jgi:hypothetical protein
MFKYEEQARSVSLGNLSNKRWRDERACRAQRQTAAPAGRAVTTVHCLSKAPPAIYSIKRCMHLLCALACELRSAGELRGFLATIEASCCPTATLVNNVLLCEHVRYDLVSHCLRHNIAVHLKAIAKQVQDALAVGALTTVDAPSSSKLQLRGFSL